MAITNGTVNSYAVSETLGTQSGQADEITFSDTLLNLTPTTADIGSLTTYVGRVVILRRDTATEETRFINGLTGNVATVSEPFDVAPASGDTVDVFYNVDDMNQDGAYLNTRTGFYEFNDDFIIQNGGGVFIGGGDLVEIIDSKSATQYGFEVQSGGRLQVGYLRGGTPVSGGVITGINNSQGETWTVIRNGATARIYDARFLASLNPLQWNAEAGSDVEADNFTFLQATDEGLYFNTTLRNGSITGASTTTEFVRINAASFFESVTLINTAGITTAAGDTTTETLTLRDCTWIGNLDFIIVNSNKTWNVINPAWAVTTFSDLNFLTGTANSVNDRRSIDVTVVDTNLSPIQNALVVVDEDLILGDLVVEAVTDVNGVVAESFNYRSHTSTTTTTFGNHSARIDAWTYTPFAQAISSTSPTVATTALSLDPYIVQTTQATALTAGAGITWNRDTNPSSIIAFTGGTGTLNVGDTVTGGTSGATGVVTDFLDGDSTGGTIHLETRNTTAFSGTETLTSTGWSGTLTSGSERFYTIWIDANALSLQTVYDYLAALTAETTLSVTGELIHEWGKGNQIRALYSDGSFFFTERSGTEGVIVVNYTGNVSRFTSDNGTTYVPPVAYTFSLTGLRDGTEVRIYAVSDSSQVAGVEDMTAGVGTGATDGVTVTGTANNNTFTYTYTYSADINVFVVIINLDFQIIKIPTGENTITLSNSSQSIPITQIIDRNYFDPD